MCFSATASLIAWVVGMVLTCILWIRNKGFDKWNAMFLWRVASVQLLEYGIWLSITKGFDPNIANATNAFFTAWLLIVLWTQPMVQVSMAYAYNPYSIVLMVLMAVYFIVLINQIWRASVGDFYSVVTGDCPTKRVFGACHLEWKDKTGAPFLSGSSSPWLGGFLTLLYLFGLFFPLIYQGWRGWVLIGFGVLTLILAYVGSRKGEALGSLWCYAAVGYGLVAVLVGI